MVDRREEILDIALALADEQGLSAVSMRAVAQRAGVTPMALYPHVGSKTALLDGLVGRLLSELAAPGQPAPPADSSAAAPPGAGPAGAGVAGAGVAGAGVAGAGVAGAGVAGAEPAGAGVAGVVPAGPDVDWRARLRSFAQAARALGQRHPWAPALLFARPSVTLEGARVIDQLYAALLDAGVPAASVPRLERLASTLVLGFVASETGGRFATAQPDARAVRTQMDVGALPAHARLASWLAAPVDWSAEFEADLDDLNALIEAAARRS
jgi:AcrR family transcriptional regulator